MMQLYAQCRCGECHPSAMRGDQCVNCRDRAAGARQAICAWCEVLAPSHRHHVHGRRNSSVIVVICRNCRAKTHSKRAA
jgi:hypothetical protein